MLPYNPACFYASEYLERIFEETVGFLEGGSLENGSFLDGKRGGLMKGGFMEGIERNEKDGVVHSSKDGFDSNNNVKGGVVVGGAQKRDAPRGSRGGRINVLNSFDRRSIFSRWKDLSWKVMWW